MILGGKCPSESNLLLATTSSVAASDVVTSGGVTSGGVTSGVRRRRRRRSKSLPNKSFVIEGPLPVKNDYDSLIAEIGKQKEMIARAAASRDARRHAPIVRRPSTGALLRAIPEKYPAPPPVIKPEISRTNQK